VCSFRFAPANKQDFEKGSTNAKSQKDCCLRKKNATKKTHQKKQRVCHNVAFCQLNKKVLDLKAKELELE
jgi:hypothetical protein